MVGPKGHGGPPGSVTVMLGLALHHPGDMEVHLLSTPTFTSPVPPGTSKATCWDC